jgi:hypothetical protein
MADLIFDGGVRIFRRMGDSLRIGVDAFREFRHPTSDKLADEFFSIEFGISGGKSDVLNFS